MGVAVLVVLGLAAMAVAAAASWGALQGVLRLWRVVWGLVATEELDEGTKTVKEGPTPHTPVMARTVSGAAPKKVALKHR